MIINTFFCSDAIGKIVQSKPIRRRCKKSEFRTLHDPDYNSVVESIDGKFYRLIGQIEESETVKAGKSRQNGNTVSIMLTEIK